MFCPQCRYEFKEGVYLCPDCHVHLVPELPSKPKLSPKSTMKPLELERVLATIDPGILALAKSHLEEADIPYLVKNEPSQGLYFHAIGIDERTVEIWVRKKDVEEARQLLQEFGDS